MTKEELYHYMESPKDLNKETVEPLRLLCETYPANPTIAFLYLYNLALIEDLRYSSELKRLSYLLPDRMFLYQMVEDATYTDQWNWVRQDEEDDTFSLVDKFLSEKGSQNEYHSGVVAASSESYFESIGLDNDIVPNETVVDTFPLPNTVEVNQIEQNTILGSSSDNVCQREDLVHKEWEEEEMFTEALAKIYIKQGKYEKALRIIRSISLNYPEKNAYFADQIRFLQRLVNNNNNK